jgi:hypothetical protein
MLFALSLVVEAKPSLTINLYKNNGYGMGDDINGQWTVNADVSQDVVFVEFYVDGQLQKNDTITPFSWEFNTQNYIIGLHYIRAVAFDVTGEATNSQISRNFVGFPTTYVVLIISIIVAVTIAVLLIAIYRIRKKR